MAAKIRFARGGAKKKPFYRIVVADQRAPRDGDFIEKIGVYNPMQPRGSAERIKYDAERVKYWLGVGAQPTEALARFLRADGLYTVKPSYVAKTKTARLPPRVQTRKDAEGAVQVKAAEEAAAAEAAKNAPAEEAPAAE